VATLDCADRGQLLLTAAFVMAILFVVLAVSLNTAIYTANLGTRGSDVSDGHHVARLQDDLQRDATDILIRVNADHNQSYASLESNLTESVDRWSELRARHAAVTGGTVTVSVRDAERWTRIRQTDATRALTNAAGGGNWTLVTDASAIREFEATVAADSLVETTNDTVAGLLDDGAFHVIVTDDDGDRWRVFLNRKPDGTVSVHVEDATGTLRPACESTPTNGTVALDVSTATVGGDACPALSSLANRTSPADVSYGFGSNATGRYSLLVDRDVVGDAAFGLSGTDPEALPVLYRADLRLEYVTADLQYRNDFTITAGDGSAR
jgi:hypothetical protein